MFKSTKKAQVSAGLGFHGVNMLYLNLLNMSKLKTGND